jgi:hypothetical protein
MLTQERGGLDGRSVSVRVGINNSIGKIFPNRVASVKKNK